MRSVLALILSVSAFAQTASAAADPNPPAGSNCQPACRTGYLCLDGRCVSECNPPCPEGYLCNNGDCQVDPLLSRPAMVGTVEPGPRRGDGEGDDYEPNDRYISVGGGGEFSAKDSNDFTLDSYGYVSIENGGQFWAGGITLGFPKDAFILGLPMRIYFPIRMQGRFFIEPQLGILFNFGFGDTAEFFQIGLGPGLRVRYDVARMFAIYVQLFSADIMVFTQVRPDTGGSYNADGVSVFINSGAGIEIRY
jgi:hypothetical protein